MGPDALSQVLRPLRDRFPHSRFPDLLIGLDITDDAAVYKIDNDTAIIQTVDFFTPVVDDPYDFGAIAAVNAMSDVYAMGGDVVLALNICAFPSTLSTEVISRILMGGADKVLEAGGILAGGHTVLDKEPKYGLSVMGIVHPDHILTENGARPGEVVILTKPLGTGIITTAAKGGKASLEHVEAAVESMALLNITASEISVKAEARCCTDITGFGLIGHVYEIAEKSGVGIHINLPDLPFLPGAFDYAESGSFPGGTCRNERCYEHMTVFSKTISQPVRQLLYTPETSGGLCLTIPEDRLNRFTELCEQANMPFWIIGEVKEGSGINILE